MNKETEMQKVIEAYANAVDTEILNFVKDVISDRDVLPITVGFITEDMNNRIRSLTGISVEGNRVVLRPDDVRHIIARHGKSGAADHSMENIEDIARISYVLANYDSIEWDGRTSHAYRTKSGAQAPQVIISKRINGTYYVIEVVSDSKSRRNFISSAYLKNSGD